MSRTLIAAAAVFALAAPAVAQTPKLGTLTQIEFTDKTPLAVGGWKQMEFIYPIEQGDKFRVQVDAFKGADMKFNAYIQKDAGVGFTTVDSAGTTATIDLTTSKPLPGRRVKILIQCDVAGKVNVLITKVGDEPAADPKDAKIKKLEDENAVLKKELADIKRQLAEVLKRLDKK